MSNFKVEQKLWEGVNYSYPYSLDTFMGEEILKKLKETPDRVVQINHDDGHEIRCEELRVSSVYIAQNLIKSGIKADDVIGVICKTSNEVTFLLNACVLIGAPINPLDLSFTKDDIKHLFGQTLPKLVICDLEVFDKVQQALTELKLDSKVCVTSKDMIDGALSFFDLLTPTGNEDEFVSPKFDQTAEEKILAILCSSGTTGLPKGVIFTHTQMMVWSMATTSPPTTRSLTFSPIYWSTGFYPHLLLAFNLSDVRIISSKGFNVETLVEIVEKYQLANLTVPPMNLAAILNSNFPQSCKHESLKSINCMGAIVSDSLRQKFSEFFPDKNMVLSYGTTEVPVAITLPGEFKESLSVGSILFPKVLVKVIDEDEKRLGVGEKGEVCAKPMHKLWVLTSVLDNYFGYFIILKYFLGIL
jgi:4-coumarate--CoA ligase